MATLGGGKGLAGEGQLLSRFFAAPSDPPPQPHELAGSTVVVQPAFGSGWIFQLAVRVNTRLFRSVHICATLFITLFGTVENGVSD